MNEEIKSLIEQADQAIKNEEFGKLMDFYSDDAVLVVRPGVLEKGKEEIRQAFVRIAQYFNNSIAPVQGKMMSIETDDTALVLSQTMLSAEKKPDSEYDMERRTTYIFRRVNDKWLCAIDNSYGTSLLD